MWLPLAVTVAVLMSAQDILSKHALKKTDAYVVTWAWWFFSLPVLYIAILFTEWPQLNAAFWQAVTMNTILLTCAVTCYIKALQSSDLSTTVPLLNFTPLLLLITSPVILREIPSPLGIFGIFMIVLGAYVLFYQSHQCGWFAPFQNLLRQKGSRYMLGVAILFSITANFDKMGVLNSSPLAYLLIVNTTLTCALTGVMLKKSRKIAREVFKNKNILMLIGLCNALALVTQMNAIEMTQVPYLIAVKRTSVMMTSMYGFIVLKERGFRQRSAGILMMVMGVLLIALS